MDKEFMQTIAAQLRQPNGEFAVEIGQRMNESNRYIHQFTFEAVQPQSNDALLEIGMGNGIYVRNIFDMAPLARYCGCDFSPEMVSEATKNNSDFVESGQTVFYTAPAHSLPLPAAHFNKIFTINTVYFWDDYQPIFAELRRVLRPEGSVFIAIRPKEVMELYPFTQFGFRLFTKEDLCRFCEENGFKVTQMIEKDEPDIEIAGEKLPVKTIIVQISPRLSTY